MIKKFLIPLWKERIYKPIVSSSMSSHEVALGSAIGMFLGFTPTVGIQMMLVWITWLGIYFFFRVRFDIVVGTAMVWISNPFTMGFLYYGFYVTGLAFLELFYNEFPAMGYLVFVEKLNAITQAPDLTFWEKAWEGFEFLMVDLGFPMMIGSLFYAVPLSVATYFFTLTFLKARAHKKRQSQHVTKPHADLPQSLSEE